MTLGRLLHGTRLALLLAAGLLAARAEAKVDTVPLDEVARSAAVVAVVRVDRLASVAGLTVARATVVRPLKGTLAGAHLAFVARPTWPCDVSDAAPGEQALVLLDELSGPALKQLRDATAARAALRRAFNEPLELRLLAHSGRGRFLIVEHDGVARAAVGQGGLTLPAALKPETPPKARAGRGPFVRLAALEAHLADVISAALPVAVSLDAATATRSGDHVLVRCTATLRNKTGAPITVRSNFGGVFDGLVLVAREADGREVARRAYIYHQSPYAEDTPYVLAPGPTTKAIVFPLQGLTLVPRSMTLQLVGGLPGHPIAWGLQSRVVPVTVVDEKRR